MTAHKTIVLDGSAWKNPVDFLQALKSAIGASEWHGMSPDAFIDSMIWGGMNTLEPPYTVMVTGLEHVPVEVIEYVDLMSRVIAEAAIEHSTEEDEPAPARIVRSLP